MTSAVRTRPLLPASYYKPSTLGTASFLLYALCLFAVPAVLLYMVANSTYGIAVKIALMVPLTIVGAFGLNLMGFVGHEGMHLSLTRNKYASAITGLFYASAIVTYFEIGFAVQHWNHHRYTNQASDYDIALVAHLKTWWSRLLFTRWIYNFAYFKDTLRIALGNANKFKYKIPFTERELCILARLNLAFSLFWLGLYATIIAYEPIAGMICIGLPMVTVLFIGACQTYIDHAGTSDELFQNAWSRTSPLMTAAYFGANYHLEHHVYPGVPCYRLPAVHRILHENGTYARVKPPVESGFLRSYRNVAAPYELGRRDSDFDPFTTAFPAKERSGEQSSESVPDE